MFLLKSNASDANLGYVLYELDVEGTDEVIALPVGLLAKQSGIIQ